jgi:hypothetical protein
VRQSLLSAEIRTRRIPASSQVNLLDALRRMTGADVGERDCALSDRHQTPSKISDELTARAAAATHAGQATSFNSNPQATQQSLAGVMPSRTDRVAPAGQSE